MRGIVDDERKVWLAVLGFIVWFGAFCWYAEISWTQFLRMFEFVVFTLMIGGAIYWLYAVRVDGEIQRREAERLEAEERWRGN